MIPNTITSLKSENTSGIILFKSVQLVPCATGLVFETTYLVLNDLYALLAIRKAVTHVPNFPSLTQWYKNLSLPFCAVTYKLQLTKTNSKGYTRCFKCSLVERGCLSRDERSWKESNLEVDLPKRQLWDANVHSQLNTRQMNPLKCIKFGWLLRASIKPVELNTWWLLHLLQSRTQSSSIILAAKLDY